MTPVENHLGCDEGTPGWARCLTTEQGRPSETVSVVFPGVVMRRGLNEAWLVDNKLCARPIEHDHVVSNELGINHPLLVDVVEDAAL